MMGLLWLYLPFLCKPQGFGLVGLYTYTWGIKDFQKWWLVLCQLSESPSRKREDLHDNATCKGREIYCWLEPGPLLQPTQWCKVREPQAPVSTHIYRVFDFKHKQWVVGASGLVTCLQSNFIGTNFRVRGTFQGTFSEVYWARTD